MIESTSNKPEGNEEAEAITMLTGHHPGFINGGTGQRPAAIYDHLRMEPFLVGSNARNAQRLKEIARLGGPHSISIASTSLADKVFLLPTAAGQDQQAIDGYHFNWVHIEIDDRNASHCAGQVLSGYVYLNNFDVSTRGGGRSVKLTLQLVGHEQTDFGVKQGGRQEIINACFNLAEWGENEHMNRFL